MRQRTLSFLATALLLPSLGFTSDFPSGHYAPFGFIQNPAHRSKNVSGHIRSEDHYNGFGFHYPNGAHPQHVTALRLGVRNKGSLLVRNTDFARRGIERYARYHTKNAISLNWSLSGIAYEFLFFRVNEQVLGCLGSLTNETGRPQTAQIDAILFHQSQREGTAGAFRDRDAALTAHSSSGHFAMAAERAPLAHAFFATERDLHVQLPQQTTAGPTSFRAGAPTLLGSMSYDIPLAANGKEEVLFCLSRADQEEGAVTALHTGLARARRALQERLTEDDRFWAQAPVLEGDWPVAWKNGVVYDLNTLRLSVRPATGIFRSPWDAMQIIWPRVVVAETALDMMILSHADPELAKEVLVGLFRDARAPNIPCVWENGQANMVAADGSQCGTAPSWCYPAYCIYSIYLRDQDREWLKRVYPGLAAHFDWWLEYRVDEDGYIVSKCVWETGQDALPRFGFEQPNGGYVIEHVRMPEHQAAVAQAGRVLSFFAVELGLEEEAARWQEVYERYREKMQSLWHDAWFYDFDTRRGDWSAMGQWANQLGPLFGHLPGLGCDLVTTEQIRTLTPYLLDPNEYYTDPPCPMGPAKYFDSVHTPKDRGYAPDNDRFSLDRIWPPTPFCLIEGAWHVGDRRAAALLSQRLINRAFETMDLRERVRDKPLPGVSYELWDINIQAPDRPVVSNFLNAAGYGWGAVTTLFLIREIFGFREKDGATDGFVLAPYFPAELLERRQSFSIRNLRFRDRLLTIGYRFSGEKLRVSVRGLPAGTRVLEDGNAVSLEEVDGGFALDTVPGAFLAVVVPRSSG